MELLLHGDSVTLLIVFIANHGGELPCVGKGFAAGEDGKDNFIFIFGCFQILDLFLGGEVVREVELYSKIAEVLKTSDFAD